MEENEIKFSLEDIRKMLERFSGAALCPLTIENIIDDFKEDFLKNLKVNVDIHDTKVDCTLTDVEMSPEFADFIKGKKTK